MYPLGMGTFLDEALGSYCRGVMYSNIPLVGIPTVLARTRRGGKGMNGMLQDALGSHPPRRLL